MGFPDRQARTGLICAIDVPSREEAFAILDAVARHLDGVKVNYPLVLAEGIGLVTEITERYGLPVFADFKVADIPFTNHGIIEAARRAGAAAIMVHAIIGERALRQAVLAGEGLAIIAQTEFTHEGAYLDGTHADELAALAREVGCRGVQAPGNRPARIAAVRRIVGPGLTIVCCGVGYQGGGFRAALDAGADFTLVGRAIHEAPDPEAAARRIVAGELG